jgi:hypothetical protein
VNSRAYALREAASSTREAVMQEEELRFASAEELAVETPPFEVGVGVSPRAWVPQPRWVGRRIKVRGEAPIYLIDWLTDGSKGFKRWIPGEFTYNNLFRDWDGIIELTSGEVENIPNDSALPRDAVLVRGAGMPEVYLIDQGDGPKGKRWVASPRAMDSYHLAWNRVYVVPPIVLEAITANLWPVQAT